MKKHLFTAIVLVAFVSGSCSSDDSGEGPMIQPPPDLDTSVTYTGTVKAIIDSRCISCHGDPLTNGAPMPLLTLANVQEAVQGRNLIGRIENGSMPPSGSDLTAAQILAIKGWQAGNFKE